MSREVPDAAGVFMTALIANSRSTTSFHRSASGPHAVMKRRSLGSGEPACVKRSSESDETRFRQRDRRPALPLGGGYGGRP
jgi:hypothetical protein